MPKMQTQDQGKDPIPQGACCYLPEENAWLCMLPLGPQHFYKTVRATERFHSEIFLVDEHTGDTTVIALTTGKHATEMLKAFAEARAVALPVQDFKL